MSYFPPHGHSKKKSSYIYLMCNKIWLKKTSQLAKKDDLANLESEVDISDIDKLTELNAEES